MIIITIVIIIVIIINIKGIDNIFFQGPLPPRRAAPEPFTSDFRDGIEPSQR